MLEMGRMEQRLHRSRAVWGMMIMVLGAMWTATAWAQEGYPEVGNPVALERTGQADAALIVAVEDYLMLPPVKGAVESANDWEMYLKRGLGVPRVHVVVNRQVTREQILRSAQMVRNEVGEGGTLWFVFIGHGAPAEGGVDGVMVGVDAQQDPESLAVRGVAQNELLGVLHEGAQERTVVIVDACFSGRTQTGEALASAQPVVPVSLRPIPVVGSDARLGCRRP
jgi:hypothetical protein